MKDPDEQLDTLFEEMRNDPEFRKIEKNYLKGLTEEERNAELRRLFQEMLEEEGMM